MAKNLFKLDCSLKEPLYMQLYQRVREGIFSGLLSVGQRVPSIRSLSSELNVARGTVELAYQLLISEGLLVAKGAQGTFIAPEADLLRRSPVKDTQGSPDYHMQQKGAAYHHSGKIVLFQLGIPALDSFPMALWARLSTRALRDSDNANLNYPDSQGWLPLRHALASYLAVSRGVICLPEQIFISSGFRSSLLLIMQSLFKHGDAGWFEEPGYHIARDFLQQIGINPLPVNVDKHGIDIYQQPQSDKQVKFALVTPTHQSPTNVTLSLERRLALLEWADKYQNWVIEDDYDSEFRYQGRPIPALKSLDQKGRVIYCGTLSKSLFPALRLSYIVVPTTQVSRFKDIAQILGNDCPVWTQTMTQYFIQEGYFTRHLRKMRNLYRERRQYLINAINRILIDICSIHHQAGGMHIVVELKGLSAVKLVMLANQEGLGIQALADWCQQPCFQQIILLGFTNITSEQEALSLCKKLKKISDMIVVD